MLALLVLLEEDPMAFQRNFDWRFDWLRMRMAATTQTVVLQLKDRVISDFI